MSDNRAEGSRLRELPRTFLSPTHRRHRGMRLFSSLFLCLFLVTEFLGGWNGLIVPSVFAASKGNPNPRLSAPSWLHSPQAVKPNDLGIYNKTAPPLFSYITSHAR